MLRINIFLLSLFAIISANRPSDFEWTQSVLQGFYFFTDDVLLNGEPLEPEDWVGAFNGDVCVGSRKWDTGGSCSMDEDLMPEYTDKAPCVDAGGTWEWNSCNSGVCDVPAMGDDGSGSTEGYMNGGIPCRGGGDIPTFKIYDASSGEFFDAIPAQEVDGWYNSIFSVNDLLGACVNGNDDMDCAGNCNGSLEFDQCGVCDGDGSSCIGDGDIPSLFQYEQSSLQAFYYFTEAFAYGYDDFLLDDADWIGAFIGDVCIGAQNWNTSECGGVCAVPVMGDDGSIDFAANTDYSDCYIREGEFPTFKIFDASEGKFYDAIPSSNEAWEANNFYTVDQINAVIIGCMAELDENYDPDATLNDYSFCKNPVYTVTLDLHPDNNLISFLTLPEDGCDWMDGTCQVTTTVGSLLDDITPPVDRILTDGSGAFYDGCYGSSDPSDENGNCSSYTNGEWIGSLTHLDTYSGYWIRLDDESATLSYEGVPIDPNKIYDLQTGLNLISYPAPGSVGVAEGLPSNIESSIEYIIGESEAAYQLDSGTWVGSLDEFRGGKGYWFSKVESLDTQFAYNIGENSFSSRVVHIEEPELPEEYKVYLSAAKAFYFMDISSFDSGGYILSYCGNTLSGARQWNGEIIDVPVMGVDSNEETAGFCTLDDIPRFEYIDPSGTTHKLHGDIQSYVPNAVQMVESMNEVPVQFNILTAYPNPFNPSTHISFELNQNSLVNLSVYDMKGAFVQEITHEVLDMGSYSFDWNASFYSSGVYMLRLSTNSEVLTQKVVLIK